MRRLLISFLSLALLLALLPSCKQEDVPAPCTLRWAFGTDWPEAEDFYTALPEGASVSFAEESPFPKNMMTKNYTVELIYQAPGGRSFQQSATLSVVVDKEPPTISGVREIAAYIGEAIAYRDGVTVSDDCDGAIALEIDSSAVDATQVGSYPVIYRATDRTGKTTTVETTVHVYEARITEAELWNLVDPLIEKLGLLGESRAVQVELIWTYVHKRGTIVYTGSSDKTDWIRGAYDALTKKQGDCYSYYSLSKAFFVRLGIENMDLYKAPRPTVGDNNSHYWSMVNIGTAEAPVWYYYDATRIDGQTWDAYLLTDRQMSYLRMDRPDLYDTDLTAYPATDTREYVTLD